MNRLGQERGESTCAARISRFGLESIGEDRMTGMGEDGDADGRGDVTRNRLGWMRDALMLRKVSGCGDGDDAAAAI